MTPDRILRAIDATLTATEAPVYDDRIPAPRVDGLTTTAALHRDLAQARDEVEQTARYAATIERERDEALANLTGVWAALNRAGIGSPTAGVGDLIGQLAAQRDEARASSDLRARIIADQAAQLRHHGMLFAALDDAAEMLDRVRAAYDTITATPAQEAADGPTGADVTSDVDTALTDAPSRAERDATIAHIRREAARVQADVAAGRISNHLGDPTPLPGSVPDRAQVPSHHVTRGCGPSEIEAGCPCPKAACGAVDTRHTNPACQHHPADRGKTMRQMHRADQCPVKPVG